MGYILQFILKEIATQYSWGVLPYKGLMGTCQSGYVFRDFCLKQGISIYPFVFNRVSFLGNFCLKQGQGFRGRVAPPHPRIYQVPLRANTPSRGLRGHAAYHHFRVQKIYSMHFKIMHYKCSFPFV